MLFGSSMVVLFRLSLVFVVLFSVLLFFMLQTVTRIMTPFFFCCSDSMDPAIPTLLCGDLID